MPKNIAVIVEGAERERQYWNNMFRVFFPDSTLHFIRLPAKQNIYSISARIKKDRFLNTIDLVRTLNKDTETRLQGLTSDDFQEIYLFFDFDPQHNLPKNQNPVSVLTDMLRIFNNETEHGKLYVSYPMVEALRDVRKENCGAFWKCAVPLDS